MGIVASGSADPPYHPNEQKRLVGDPVSDDRTVAKMGHPVLWSVETPRQAMKPA